MEFNTDMAKNYGVNVAIFVQQSLQTGSKIFSHSINELCKIYPFWTKSQLRLIIKKCESLGIIVKEKNNEKGKWNRSMYKILTENINQEKLLVPKRARIETKLNIEPCPKGHELEQNCTAQKINRAQKGTNWNKTEQLTFIACALFERNPSVMKVYRYTKYITIYLTMIILTKSIYKQKEKEKNKRKRKSKNEVLAVDNYSKKLPCSPEHIFNSKHVLATLNSLVYPAHRLKPFEPSRDNLGYIVNWLKNGYSVADCLHVIKNKFTMWNNNPEMAACLQPSTLFGKRFPNYVGEKLYKQENGHEKNSNFSRSIKNRSKAAENAACIYEQLGAALTIASEPRRSS